LGLQREEKRENSFLLFTGCVNGLYSFLSALGNAWSGH